MRFLLCLAFFLLFVFRTKAGGLFDLVTSTTRVSIVYATEGPKLDSIAAALLAADIESVTGYRPMVTTNLANVRGNAILIGGINSKLIQSLNDAYFSPLQAKWECFSRKLIRKPAKNISQALVIAGSDARGTAYGVFALSKMLGVSPWYWWADVHPKKRKELRLRIDPFTSAPPAVKYRGLFINDEDWGLQPWAAKTFEPETGDIGPKTYAKVFELLLRLKGNLLWPAMHPSTKAFFYYPGNVKTAEDYQIVIGSSHAEPMLRNNVSEWDAKTMGPFNYLTNKETILRYWDERVRESKDLQAIYTVGIRGVHDSQMEGVKDAKEAVPFVEDVMRAERGMLARHINKDTAAVPQAFTPYKEVLDIYDNGLRVPEDVTLVWPDDNYGYIARLNNEAERSRTGGAGVYYHASYWGRPHDYLWLPSTHPSLLREEMLKAYETGANRLWVLNAGDIKPQEYNLQQFLDMACNPAPFKDSRYTQKHLQNWTVEIFGKEKGEKGAALLWNYFQLAFERKPEFMGWSQTEPNTPTTYSEFNHFFFGDEAQKRIDRFTDLEARAKALRKQITSADADAFYQLIYYPVVNASGINKKFLFRDKAFLYAKQNRQSAFDYAAWSKAAYDSIASETIFYNQQLAGGKWKHIMSMAPRNLAVYQAPVLSLISIDSTAEWNLSPEGLVPDSVRSGSAPSLPRFDNVNRQKFFVDLFLQKDRPVAWSATVSTNWIRLSKSTGLLSPAIGKREVRIWVEIDWEKFPASGEAGGTVQFKAAGKMISLPVQAMKADKVLPKNYKGFVENNGYVSIHAAHFTRQSNRPSSRWNVVNGLGYAGEALQAFPLTVSSRPATNADSIQRFNAVAEYEFYNFTQAVPTVTVMALPTHPINNNFRVRYAVAIDEGPLKIADGKTTGRSEEWKQNVLRNRSERKIEGPLLKAGKHTLKLYAIDPGVVVDEIRIDLGGLKKAYSLLPETKAQ